MNCKEAVYIVSAVRTPVGSFCGKLSTIPAHQLGSVVINEAIRRANVAGDDVREVIFGHVLIANEGQNPVRQASIAAGLPICVPASSVNMLCGSGLKSVALGYQAIMAGDANVIIVGGQENMSRAPHAVLMRLQDRRLGDVSLIDTAIKDGLTDAFKNGHMGDTAENVARDYSVSREDQDQFAALSQKKYTEAKKEGYFSKEIVPVPLTIKGVKTEVIEDEFPKPETTVEKLSKLRPAFQANGGTVTAGNSSGLNDGAAALVLMSRTEVEKRKAQTLAKIVAWAQVGIEPRVMGIGPVNAIKKALEKAKWTLEEVDLFEINEAFAAQSVAVIRELGIDASKVNIQGGSISIGHPIGASGARILVTLLHSLERTQLKRGVASLCIGGGMGIALCVERV